MATPYPRQTELAEIKVRAMHQHVMRRFAEIKKEGGFIGDQNVPGPARLERYWASITDPATGAINFDDMNLIIDPNGEQMIRLGLAAPQSPTWINYLRIPGLFTEHAKDFIALNAADVKRRQGGGNEVAQSPGPQAAPIGAGGGLPLPLEATLGPPQPGAGGNPGSGAMYPQGMT